MALLRRLAMDVLFGGPRLVDAGLAARTPSLQSLGTGLSRLGRRDTNFQH